MQIVMDEMLRKLRIALDEQLGDDVDSDFTESFEAELRQALWVACMQLLSELPEDRLLPTTLTDGGLSIHVTRSDGTGMVSLPPDFLRLVRFKLRSWSRGVVELTDARSEKGLMQGSRWTRGTPQKPVCMLGVSSGGFRMMEYYTAGRYSEDAGEVGFDHRVEVLSYVGKPSVSESALEVALTADCEPYILYRAAGIVMEGKQNSVLADRFYKLSVIG